MLHSRPGHGQHANQLDARADEAVTSSHREIELARQETTHARDELAVVRAELEKVRAELDTAAAVTGDAEARVSVKLDAAARELKAEREKAAAVELAHNAALVAAASAANALAKDLRAALAAAQAEAARDKERVVELQKSVEHLTRAGEEAKELWTRLKEALMARARADAARAPAARVHPALRCGPWRTRTILARALALRIGGGWPHHPTAQCAVL